MVSFFTKKKYLVDLLEGFIDIHNHILPGIDDGAKTVEDSMNIINGFAAFGVHDFIATPHIMHNYYDNTPTTIQNAMHVLQEALSAQNGRDVSVRVAAEHMIDSHFEQLLEEQKVMLLGREHLLIEMSYLQPPINFDEAVKAITNKWFFPILAHPERYNFLHSRRRKYAEFKEQNILFQLNMLSLGEYYGKEVSKIALKLLEEGMIDFIGSDVHHVEHINALKKVTISKKVVNRLIPVIEKTIETFRP